MFITNFSLYLHNQSFYSTISAIIGVIIILFSLFFIRYTPLDDGNFDMSAFNLSVIFITSYIQKLQLPKVVAININLLTHVQ